MGNKYHNKYVHKRKKTNRLRDSARKMREAKMLKKSTQTECREHGKPVESTSGLLNLVLLPGIKEKNISSTDPGPLTSDGSHDEEAIMEQPDELANSNQRTIEIKYEIPSEPGTSNPEPSRTTRFLRSRQESTKTHARKRPQPQSPELIHAKKQTDQTFEFMKSVFQDCSAEDECTTFGALIAKKLRKLSEERRDVMMARINQLFIDEQEECNKRDSVTRCSTPREYCDHRPSQLRAQTPPSVEDPLVHVETVKVELDPTEDDYDDSDTMELVVSYDEQF